MNKEYFDELKNTVLAEETVLKDIYYSFGRQSMYDYVKRWDIYPGEPKDVFIENFEKLLGNLYNSEIVSGVSVQLKRSPLISTIDHHGILCHPFFINSNLLYDFQSSEKYLICLSTAGVSMNNHSHPGKLLITNNMGNGLDSFSLFSGKYKHKIVLALEAFKKNHLDGLEKSIHSQKMSEGTQSSILDVVEKTIKPYAGAFEFFWQQASIISSELWNLYFPSAKKLIYFPIEKLVTSILVTLLEKNDDFFSLLLCSEKGFALAEKHFSGLQGSFISSEKGSFLFWGIHNQERVHMHLDGTILKGKGIEIPLNKRSLLMALESGTLYPTSLICFLVMLYCNVTCLGGFNQTSWLTNIKEHFLEMLTELSMHEDVKKIQRVETKNFAESTIAFLKWDGRIIKATGLDIYTNDNKKLYGDYIAISKTITVSESIDMQLPEIYRVVTPSHERVLSLMEISEQQIFTKIGLEKRIDSIPGLLVK